MRHEGGADHWRKPFRCRSRNAGKNFDRNSGDDRQRNHQCPSCIQQSRGDHLHPVDDDEAHGKEQGSHYHWTGHHRQRCRHYREETKQQENAPGSECHTWRLATPVADASPTAGVEVFIPTLPPNPPSIVESPSANTPRVTEPMSGRTQLASFMRWQTVTVPAAFIAAAMLAMANGAASGMSNDQEMWPNVGRPIHGVALSEAYVRLS